MAKNLVIVESPTKAKTISKYLGKNYKVIASVGHLRDLPKSSLGVDIENNFEPKYINVRGKAKKINELKDAAKKADNVFLATDPDREGEAIAWHITGLLNLDDDAENRVEFPEITSNTVKMAIKTPKKINKSLVDAQQARRVLDRIVGYKISPILWKKVKSGLSAGRVQSVALKLIVEREGEIRAFNPVEYWSVTAFLNKSRKNFQANFYGKLVNGKVKKIELKDEKSASDIIASCEEKEFVVREIKKTKKTSNPQVPFTTSTLQQEASKKLGFSTSKTMSLAQRLYEGININGNQEGLISYMRTDSTRLSEGIVKDCIKYINDNYGSDYASRGRAYSKKRANSQDAHEGIRPNNIFLSPDKISGDLSRDEYKLYNLIWSRTIQSQMTASKYESTKVTIVANDKVFYANGNITLFDGYKRVWPSADSNVELPKMEEGDLLKFIKIEKDQHFTKPPARYTEASLVKTLEENGIGRPSTYASIIKNILSRNYVRIEKKAFYATELGENVNSLLNKNFPDIINVEFTANMESKLDEIEEKNLDWRKVIGDFYTIFEKDLSKALKDHEKYKLEDKKTGEKCPECGNDLVYKDGRNGKFIGCSNFPSCTFTKNIIKSTGVKCPKCGGKIIEKFSKRGKLFFGCENYPDCDFASWDKPLDEKCPKCGDILTHRKNRKENVIKCHNEECDYERPFDK